jgi:hypothetical protein
MQKYVHLFIHFSHPISLMCAPLIHSFNCLHKTAAYPSLWHIFLLSCKKNNSNI